MHTHPDRFRKPIMVLGVVVDAGEIAWEAIHQSAVAAACIVSAIRVGILGFGPSYKKPSPESPRIKHGKPSARAATFAPLPTGGGVMSQQQQQEVKIAEKEFSPRSVFSLPPLPAPQSKTPSTKAVSPAAEERDQAYHLHHPPLHTPMYEGLGGGMAAGKPEMTPRPWSGRVLSQSGRTSPGGPKRVVKCSVM